MAIVKMKYVEIGASVEDYKEMLIRCSHSDCFHVELASSLYRKDNGERLLPQDNKYADAMSQLNNLIVHSGHKLELKSDISKFSDTELREHIKVLNEQFSPLATENSTKYELTSADEVALNIMRKVGFDKFHSTMFIKFIFGRMPVNSYTKLLLHKSGLFKHVVLHKDSNYFWLCLAISATYYQEVYDILDSLYFEDLRIPTVDINELVGNYLDEISTLYTYCNYRNDLLKLYKYVRIVDNRYVVSGFVPVPDTERFMDSFKGLDVYFTLEDPKEVSDRIKPLSLDPQVFAEGLSKVNLNKISNSEFLKFTFGVVNNHGFEQLNLYDENLFKLYDLSGRGALHYVCYVTTKDLFREVRKIFEDSGFNEITMKQADLDYIVKVYTEDADDEERITDIKEKFAKIDDYFKIEDSATKAIKAPTLSRNNWFFRPFELFVDMYGIPSYNGIDPTAFVAITYFLLFGIMFGDMGQGLIFVFLGFFLAHRNPENKLFGIIGRIGISSTIFGFLYGSVFGLENVLNPVHQALFNVPDKLFEVMASSSTMTLIAGAVGIGVVLIMISMIINMYIRLKNHEIGEMLFNQNGVTGLVFYTYIVLMMLGSITGLYSISNLFTNLVFIGIPIVIFLLEEPLTSMVEGDGFKTEDGWGRYFSQIPFEMFELLLSFVTNTMSYMRVGGFVLSHAGMMMVVMILMEMTSGAASIVVLILGNIFVMCLEGLIVGIQALRLELYEMFSRYFRAGGRKFILISKEN